MTNLKNQNENQENQENVDVQLVNCVPHAVHIMDFNGNYVTTAEKREEPPARVGVEYDLIGMLGNTGIPLYNRKFGKVENMPEPKTNTYYIVSMPVAQALPERHDLLQAGELIRDENGVPTNCVGLVMP